MGTVLQSTWEWHCALEKLVIHADCLEGYVFEALSFEIFKIIILFRASQRKGRVTLKTTLGSECILHAVGSENRYLELVLPNGTASSTQELWLT